LALFLYISSAAPGLTWAHDGADGGDLIAATMSGGVPHPSGYPTYCLLARGWALLPLGDLAHRFNLFSAVMAAGAVALLCLCALRLRARPLVAGLAALAAGCAPVLWSQALITEVYALSAFFLTLCLYLALRHDLLARAWGWGLLGSALGVGLGAHLTLLLATPGLAVLLWPARQRRRLAGGALGLLLGLSVYAYLPLAARGDPPVNWGAADTWVGFWWMISGQLYRGYVFALPWARLPARLAAWAQQWSAQYTWAGLALALGGVWSWLEQRQRAPAAATGLIWLASTLYALGYDTTDSYVYLIPAYLVTALWLAAGAEALLGALGARWGHGGVAVGLALLALLPLYQVISHYPALSLREERAATGWLQEVLRSAPTDALLITGQDTHTFALSYAQWAAGQRQDLAVVDGELWQQPWYAAALSRRYALAATPDAPPPLAELVAANVGRRSVYLTSVREELAVRYTLTPRGVLWQLTPRP
jgi:hypothetical protein